MIPNSIQSVWLRVSRNHHCEVCDHTDWCTYTEEGASCCMRVQNNHPMKNGGYLHLKKDTLPSRKYIPITKANHEASIDAASMINKWKIDLSYADRLMAHSSSLGVTAMALHMIGCVWAPQYDAWAFPMNDGDGKIIGIRLRNEKGDKWAVTGSRAGIFSAIDFEYQKTLTICEGPTDCAAALDLGFSAIGRPSCLGSESIVNDFIKKKRISKALIISDNDNAGLTGSEKLQTTLKVPSLIVVLPSKDIRDFLKNGGTKEVIESIQLGRVWCNPNK